VVSAAERVADLRRSSPISKRTYDGRFPSLLFQPPGSLLPRGPTNRRPLLTLVRIRSTVSGSGDRCTTRRRASDGLSSLGRGQRFGVCPTRDASVPRLFLTKERSAPAWELCSGLMNRYVPTEIGAFCETRDSGRRECGGGVGRSSSRRQSLMRQRVVAMLDSEKNRCVLCRGLKPKSRQFATHSEPSTGTLSGTIVGTTPAS
jgi:hypothetical protein